MKEFMKNNKLVIGMVHLPALPGSSSFDDDANLSKTFKNPHRIEVIDKNGTLTEPMEGFKIKLKIDVRKIVEIIHKTYPTPMLTPISIARSKFE